tara:strand:- start:48 stop:443 length:396 start_codon:yes stop_codon:yes gene_type:complete
MEIEKIFKNLILVDFALLILIVISSMYQSTDIIEVNQNLENGLFSEYEYFIRIISLILFFLYLLTLNLLYRFISYGKKLYLFLVIAGLILNFLNGSVVYSSFGSVLDQVGGIVTGAILILLFYSPIKNNFK